MATLAKLDWSFHCLCYAEIDIPPLLSSFCLKWFWKIPAETTEQLKQWIHGTEHQERSQGQSKGLLKGQNRDLANSSERNIYSFESFEEHGTLRLVEPLALMVGGTKCSLLA